MICPECKNEVFNNPVCTNCGLVIEEFYIKNNLTPRWYDNDKYIDLSGSFINPLSPDIEYSHIYPKYSRNENLNRIFKRQKQKKKTEQNFYFRDMKEIERICQYLQLPKTILDETLNIRKWLGKDEGFFLKKNYYKLMACIKIAIKIHDYPINKKNFISLISNYPLVKKGDKIILRGNEIKKEIDKEYVDILHNKLKLIIPKPSKPKFISYVCNKLGLNYEYELYSIYSKISRFFNQSCSINGYILGLVHILYGKTHKIRIIDLEKKFGVNRLTISSRKKELKKILEMINIGKIKG